jgi:hypothetical protein
MGSRGTTTPIPSMEISMAAASTKKAFLSIENYIGCPPARWGAITRLLFWRY